MNDLTGTKPRKRFSVVVVVVIYVFGLLTGAFIAAADFFSKSDCGWDYPTGWQSWVAKMIAPTSLFLWVSGLVIIVISGDHPNRNRRYLFVFGGWVLIMLIDLIIMRFMLDRTPKPNGCLL